MMNDVRRVILYYANIQGPRLIESRSIRRNISMAGTSKVLSICSALKKNGHDVVVYSLGSPAERSGRYYCKLREWIELNNGDKIAVLYSANVDNRILRPIVGGISAIMQMAKMFKEFRIDTIIIYNLSLLSVVVALVGRILRCDVYLEYEDDVSVYRERKVYLNLKKILRIYEAVVGKCIDGVFGASEELIEKIKSPNRIVVPGVLDDLMICNVDPIEEKKISERAINIIYSGGFDESKGIDRFLMAINKIDREIKMRVCGTGNNEKKVLELCLNNKHEIEFCGYVTRSELRKNLLWADVAINPHRSDLHDGGSWPFKVIEYLAMVGTVFCNRTNFLDEDLASRLYLYNGNDVESICSEFNRFLDNIDINVFGFMERKMWAVNNYSVNAIANKFKSFMIKKK